MLGKNVGVVKEITLCFVLLFLHVLCFSHISGQTFPFLIFLSSILGGPGLGYNKRRLSVLVLYILIGFELSGLKYGSIELWCKEGHINYLSLARFAFNPLFSSGFIVKILLSVPCESRFELLTFFITGARFSYIEFSNYVIAGVKIQLFMFYIVSDAEAL